MVFIESDIIKIVQRSKMKRIPNNSKHVMVIIEVGYYSYIVKVHF